MRLVPASARLTVVDMSTDSENEVPQLRGNRFAALGESQEGRDVGNRRRLVLISQRADDVRDREWDSDTESVGGASDVEVSEVVEPTVAESPVVLEARVRAPVRAFASLDAVNLVDLFDHRARVMRSVPHVLKGVFRMALRVAFQEIFDGTEANNEARVVRGWKLFLLLPRMLLFKPPRGGVVPRKKLESRIRLFQEGEWLSLLRDSATCSEMAHTSAVRRRRRGQAEDAVRASRALSLVQMGELSSARQALEGAPLAPGNLATLGILTDPSRRPPTPRRPLSEEVRVAEPAEPFVLDSVEFLVCLRKGPKRCGPQGHPG